MAIIYIFIYICYMNVYIFEPNLVMMLVFLSTTDLINCTIHYFHS